MLHYLIILVYCNYNEVQSFKYLGTYLHENGLFDKEISQCVATAGRMFSSVRKGILKKCEVSKRTKMAVHKLKCLPLPTYPLESWTLTSKHKSNIQASEMRYQRRVEGKPKRDKDWNSVNRFNIDLRPTTDIIGKQLRWFGHFLCMNENHIARKTYKQMSREDDLEEDHVKQTFMVQTPHIGIGNMSMYVIIVITQFILYNIFSLSKHFNFNFNCFIFTFFN